MAATEASVMAVIRASRPSFRNAHDKVAFAIHSAFLSAGYALTAAGKNAFSDSPPTGEEEVGIEGWNEFEDAYGFVYTKSSRKGAKKRVLVKCLVVEDVLVVDALSLEEDQTEPFNLQINVRDYSSEGSTGSYGELYRNIGGLVGRLNSGVLNKLEPPPKDISSSSTSGARGGTREPSSIQPAVGVPVEPQPFSPGIVYPPVPSSDFSDVYPGPGAGFYPGRGVSGGGSMLVGPHDPRFGAVGVERPDFPGYPGGVPGALPGVRFDPYGPPGVPGFEPSRFVRRPRRPGGGTHPDLEHFQGPDYI